ncbi:MAG: EF-P beta-lysylation protein EpmB [Gammaproteobacteria bacterium]
MTANALLSAPPLWQQELATAFSDLNSLCRYLQLSITDLPISAAAATSFPLRVPRGFAARIEKGNPEDPLLRQILPVSDELATIPGFNSDPVGDLHAVAAPAVLHKYSGRALLITTGGCAINCRYCFRRNFPYSQLQLGKNKEDSAISYISAHNDISEVILSGGDPLLLSDQRLYRLIAKLSGIAHLKRLRIHTRLPVVLPSRITDALIEVLVNIPQQTVVVLHSNHANEISSEVAAACVRLKTSGITLLNQAVLLKGINDCSERLCDLSETLFAAGVLPYYLHLLDRAEGTAHFEVSETEAAAIMRRVQHRLPGYLVPKLVREQPGAQSKLAVVY